MTGDEVYLIAPFYSERAGLSYESLGELLQYTRELGYGRYPIQNGSGKTFHLVLYEDGSWRISTPQLELFQETVRLKPMNCDHVTDPNAMKSPHTLT